MEFSQLVLARVPFADTPAHWLRNDQTFPYANYSEILYLIGSREGSHELLFHWLCTARVPPHLGLLFGRLTQSCTIKAKVRVYSESHTKHAIQSTVASYVPRILDGDLQSDNFRTTVLTTHGHGQTMNPSHSAVLDSNRDLFGFMLALSMPSHPRHVMPVKPINSNAICLTCKSRTMQGPFSLRASD